MVAGIITDLTDWLDRTSGHKWFLLVILVIAFLDSVIPVVPSETCVIIGGVAAGLGTQNLLAVITAGAIGAFLGDNCAYMIGLRASDWFRRRAERKPKFARKLAWAHLQILERGGLLLITARFIPGGRTVLTLSCGITRQRRWWFVRWVALATTIWASYSALLVWPKLNSSSATRAQAKLNSGELVTACRANASAFRSVRSPTASDCS